MFIRIVQQSLREALEGVWPCGSLLGIRALSQGQVCQYPCFYEVENTPSGAGEVAQWIKYWVCKC